MAPKIFSSETRCLHLIAPTVASGTGPALQEEGNFAHHCCVIRESWCSALVYRQYFPHGGRQIQAWAGRNCPIWRVSRGSARIGCHPPFGLARRHTKSARLLQGSYTSRRRANFPFESAVHAHTTEQPCGEGHEGAV
jgi:hypothetical protein